MALSKFAPEKYRVVSREIEVGFAKDMVYYVLDADNKTVCECDKIYNAKIIRNLLEKYT